MKSTTSMKPLRLKKPLVLCAAAGAALALSMFTTNAKADVVYSGATAIAVPQNYDGVYLDLATGQASTSPYLGYDVNPYYDGNIDSLTFFPGDGTTFVAQAANSAPSSLSAGAFIGSTDIFSGGSSGANFLKTGTEYLGLQFVNSTTGAADYGWVALSTTAGSGYPATILGYAYEDSGASILAGQTTNAVPEPTTYAMLAGGAALLFAGRRLRKPRRVS